MQQPHRRRAPRGAGRALPARRRGCARCPLAATRHQRRLRRRQRRRRPDVRRRGARRSRRTCRACRSWAGPASSSTSCSRRSGLARDDVFITNVLKSPAAGQPRSPARGDRGLPALPLPPDRADRATRDLHARELRHQAAHAHAAAGSRRSAGARRCTSSAGARSALYPLFHPAAALRTPARAGGAARGLQRASPPARRAAAGAAGRGRARWRAGAGAAAPAGPVRIAHRWSVESAGARTRREAAGAAPGGAGWPPGRRGARERASWAPGRRPSCAAPAARSG